MPRTTRFPTPAVFAVMAVPTVMTAMGHPLVGAATLGGVLLAWLVQTGLLSRAEQARQARLDRARTAVPAGYPPRAVSALRPLADDDELFRPDDAERPWVHLRPTEY